MTAWVVRAGAMGQDEQYNREHRCATVGWDVPDMGPCTSREDVRQLVDLAYPANSPHKSAAVTGQLWAFRGRIALGDLVVMPLKSRPGYLLFGVCAGDYRYVDADHGGPRHALPVTWDAEPVSKVGIKDDLLYSLNSIQTVFSPSRNNAEERLRAVARTGADPGTAGLPSSSSAPIGSTPTADDEAITDPSPVPTAEAVRDRIRTHLDENFKGHNLTRLVADVLRALGFRCEVSAAGPDGGVDILAGMGPLGLDSPTLIVEVKSETTAVGAPVVRGLHSAMTQYQADQALLVALGGTTSQADKEFAHIRTKLRVWDADELLEQVFRTYEQLPDSTRADLPLKRTWILAD